MCKRILVFSTNEYSHFEKTLKYVFQQSIFKISNSLVYDLESLDNKYDLTIILHFDEPTSATILNSSHPSKTLVLTTDFDIEKVKSLYGFGAKYVIPVDSLDQPTLDSILIKTGQTASKDTSTLVYNSDQRYKELVQHSKALICSHDLDGNIISTNKTFQEQIGYSKDELIGYSFRDLINPKALTELNEYFININKHKEADGILNILTKDKQSKYWNFKNILVNEEGRSPIVICYGQDITDRVKVEKTLLRAQKLIKESVDFQQQFIKNISHQIRTPLNAIIGLTSHFANNLSSTQLQSFESIKTSSDRLIALLESIEDYSNLDLSSKGTKNNKFTPSSLLESIILFHRLKAQKKGLKFDYEIIDNNSIHLFGDTLRFNQIITHLLNNAIKFTNTGGVHVKLIVKRQSKRIANVILEVSDTGSGIPHAFHDVIFNPFNKPVTHELTQGPGLGLSIVKAIVDSLNGTINVISAEGKGSVFTVNIDYDIFQEPKFISNDPIAKKLSGTNILVCEDNEINQTLISKIFEGYNVKLTIVNNGQEAIEQCNTHFFDIILMDLQMPIKGGIEAAIELRSYSNIPIIALTAGSSDSERKFCIANGFNDYISKPFDELNLFRTIIKNIGNQNVLDLSRIKDLANGDKEFINHTLTVFVEKGSSDLEKIFEAVTSSDKEKIIKQAHKMKSSFLMFGILDATQICENLCDNINEINIQQNVYNLKRVFNYASIEIDESN